MSLYWDKKHLTGLVQDYRSKRCTLKATFGSQDLWEAHITSSNSQLLNLAKDTFLTNRVSNSFDRIGVTELNIIEVMTKEIYKTTQDGWMQKFLINATFDFPTIQLVPDTNFIIRKYVSGLLRRLGEPNFSKLRFSVPSLVILEIEAFYNRAKKNYEKLNDHISSRKVKPDEERKRIEALFDINEALIATKELMFLREKSPSFLESNVEGIIDHFSKNSSIGSADMSIRRQIRDASNKGNFNTRFLTCDLMNALSAVAEGLPTFYFSRIPSKTHYFSEKYDTCMEQVTDLILDTTVMFGEVTFTACSASKLVDCKTLKGKWVEWTIEDLLNDRVIEERSE